MRGPGSIRATSTGRKGSYSGTTSSRRRRRLSVSIGEASCAIPCRRPPAERKPQGILLKSFGHRRSPGPSTPMRAIQYEVNGDSRSRPTSWVTVSPDSPTMRPASEHTSRPMVPLELADASESDTAIVTPTSVRTPESEHKELGDAAPPSRPMSPCLLERLCPPAALERKKSITKKPAPGRVYVFDVVSEEACLTSPAQPSFAQVGGFSSPPGSAAGSLLASSGQGVGSGAADTVAARAARTARLATSAQRAPLAFRTSPWMRVVMDVVFLFSHVALLPRMFVPCRRHSPTATKPPTGNALSSGCPPGATHCRGHITDATLTQALLVVLSIVVTVLGFGSLVACMPTVLALLGLVLLAEVIQGPMTRESNRPDVENVAGADREAWFL